MTVFPQIVVYPFKDNVIIQYTIPFHSPICYVTAETKICSIYVTNFIAIFALNSFFFSLSTLLRINLLPTDWVIQSAPFKEFWQLYIPMRVSPQSIYRMLSKECLIPFCSPSPPPPPISGQPPTSSLLVWISLHFI